MRRCIMPCAGLLLISGAAAQTVQTFEAVEVQGEEFVPEHDIQMTCGAVEGVPYLTIELRAIEDCLMSTGVFETVKLIPNGETLVIAVKELNTRPGRVEASLSYASQDGLIGGLFFERYNLLPDTYGSVRLEYNPEVKRGGGRLYRTDALGSDFDLGSWAGKSCLLMTVLIPKRRSRLKPILHGCRVKKPDWKWALAIVITVFSMWAMARALCWLPNKLRAFRRPFYVLF